MKNIEDFFATIPLELYGTIPVGVARDCFVLICFKSKLTASITNITISDKHKKLLGLNRLGYYRGIQILERLKIITVIRGNGKAYQITLVKEKFSNKMLNYILNGKRQHGTK